MRGTEGAALTKAVQPCPPGDPSLLSAVLTAVRELQISMQNVLAAVSTFVIPSLLVVVGTPMSVAIACGACVVLWFLLLKACRYTGSMLAVFLVGGVLSGLIICAGFAVSALAIPQPVIVSPNERFTLSDGQQGVLTEFKITITTDAAPSSRRASITSSGCREIRDYGA